MYVFQTGYACSCIFMPRTPAACCTAPHHPDAHMHAQAAAPKVVDEIAAEPDAPVIMVKGLKESTAEGEILVRLCATASRLRGRSPEA